MTRTLIAVALALLFAVCTPPARTAADRDHDELVLLLARYGVHEANLRDAHADHLAVWEVLKQRAEGPLWHVCRGDLRCAALRYSAGRSENVTNDRNRWVLDLNFAGTEPEGWPRERARWSRARDAWLATLDRAEAWLDGNLRARCRYRPMHWGGMRIARDRARADRAVLSGRWRNAQCRDETGKPTRNRFFCVAGQCEWRRPRH